jgi:hypothetical protein
MEEQHFDALPPVQLPAEQTGDTFAEGVTASPKEREASKAMEQPSQGIGPTQPAPVSSAAAPADPLMAPTNASPSATVSLSPLMADDSDLIEKEWVEKAKQIVEQTKDDPHRQNEEINRVKADYLKKRYNHDLRVGN